ncbi:MAG: acyl carrier protein [Spirochaetaceae bacterium]|nr:acyl carrier protein [Spirochaetaceae bacterium]
MSDISTITQPAVQKAVRDFIVENFLFGVEDANLTDQASFLETGIIDSTGILELVAFIETEYDITIQDEEMLPRNLDSLENISAFVIRKRNGVR